jgi:shikimate dehydrogenase
MKKFISISEYPGTNGTYFYNNFFKQYKFEAEYKSVSASKSTFEQIFKKAIDEGIKGISISMPFKKTVIDLLDEIDNNVELYQLCNTVVVNNGKLKGYNCDFDALSMVSNSISQNDRIKILGNGAIGSMAKKFLEKDYAVEIYSRSLDNWHLRHNNADVVFNCTSLGTIPGCPLDYLNEVLVVYDYSIGKTMLADLSYQYGVKYVGGLEFYKFQFSKQFEIYTDLKFNLDLYNELFRARYD